MYWAKLYENITGEAVFYLGESLSTSGIVPTPEADYPGCMTNKISTWKKSHKMVNFLSHQGYIIIINLEIKQPP